MQYRLNYRPYSRRFRQPLLTSHGLWSDRQGILLQLTDAEGQVGLGEIAPIEWFGSESLSQALAFCQQLPEQITIDTIFSIPDSLPACQFGFESAWESLDDSSLAKSNPTLTYSSLLPTGKAALSAWEPLWSQGSRTFKWKIGVAPVAEELQVFTQLVHALPSTAKLRLDANAGLNWQQACTWLEVADSVGVEFLEQPLPVSQFDQLLKLSDRFQTPLALDESVATLAQMQQCYQQGWRGIFVVKAAIAGSPGRLRQFCRTYEPDVVWSSVFETAIARRFIETKLIADLPPPSRAIGFGTEHWFAEDWQASFENVSFQK
ncbi:o-succinylbenzoate synthase [Oculatella sp. FACHB-28]|uniref:o-succinylbenzoate synthase n=1 Tax=Oculatella sp. FACHB-28 TaxID=2692845 RepID=UPI001689D00F|nr:o-succinylbenzoate synthase [Oculatella sp. FACHB-28]MBD2055086.1 o-succinylbenzoate synthase [Oculatella sp. FACHB-28]